MPSTEDGSAGFPQNTATSRWIFAALGIMAIGASLAFWVFSPEKVPPPADVAADAVLSRGREVFLSNCANCHGELGHGNGPLSKTISGPPARDFREEWKYGSEPDQALNIVRNGAPDSAMPGWKSALSETDMKSVTAYVFYLAGKPVPATLR